MKKHPLDWLLPEFPRIPHLIKTSDISDDDIVVNSDNILEILANPVIVEEKLDGSNCGMAYEGNMGYIRNRKHILSKNYTQEKRTPAKEQFLSAWGWQTDHKELFMKLYKLAGEQLGVYGEWCLAVHGITYDQLPDKFVAYGLYSPSKKDMLDVASARTLLSEAGFNLAYKIYEGIVNLNDLKVMASEYSNYSSIESREGVVVKVIDTNEQYKVLRGNYHQNVLWDNKIMRKQDSWLK